MKKFVWPAALILSTAAFFTQANTLIFGTGDSTSLPIFANGTLIDFEEQPVSVSSVRSLTIGNATLSSPRRNISVFSNSFFGGPVFNTRGQQALFIGSPLSRIEFRVEFSTPVRAFAFNLGNTNVVSFGDVFLGNNTIRNLTIPAISNSNAGNFFGFESANGITGFNLQLASLNFAVIALDNLIFTPFTPELSIIPRASNVIDNSPITVSSEGLSIVESNDDTSDNLAIAITPRGNNLTVGYLTIAPIRANDIVTLTLEGATITEDSTPLLSNTPLVSNTNLSFLSTENRGSTGSTILFRATETVPAGVLTLSGIALENVISPGEITLAARASFGNGSLSFNEVAATPIAVIRSQFVLGDGRSSGDLQFNAVIDLENMRQQFISGNDDPGPNLTFSPNNSREADSELLDNFFVSIDSNQTELINTDVVGANLTLNATDLSFLRNTDGELEISRFDTTSVLGAKEIASPILNEANNQLITGVITDPGGYIGLGLRPLGVVEEDAPQLTPQSFSAQLEVNYKLGGVNTSIVNTNIAAGAWGINGTIFNIPFMPFGPEFGQVISLSNSGDVAGEIELLAFDDEGSVFGPVLLPIGTGAGKVTQLSQAITSALLNEGFDGNGELDIILTINAPFAEVDVYANYRALIPNDRVNVTVIKRNEN